MENINIWTNCVWPGFILIAVTVLIVLFNKSMKGSSRVGKGRWARQREAERGTIINPDSWAYEKRTIAREASYRNAVEYEKKEWDGWTKRNPTYGVEQFFTNLHPINSKDVEIVEGFDLQQGGQ